MNRNSSTPIKTSMEGSACISLAIGEGPFWLPSSSTASTKHLRKSTGEVVKAPPCASAFTHALPP